MKLRRLPSTIPIYTWEDSKKYIRQSVYDNALVESIVIVVTLCCHLVLRPWYFIKHLGWCLWTVVRYCTYSLNDKEEAVVQRVIKEKPIIGIDCPKCNRRIHTDYIRNTVTYAQCSRCMWRFAWDTSDGTFDPKKIITNNEAKEGTNEHQ